MKKKIMKLACQFNGWLYKKYGVLSATQSMYYKEVHLKPEAFFDLFKEYERIDIYTGDYSKVYVKEDGVTYFALVDDDF